MRLFFALLLLVFFTSMTFSASAQHVFSESSNYTNSSNSLNSSNITQAISSPSENSGTNVNGSQSNTPNTTSAASTTNALPTHSMQTIVTYKAVVNVVPSSAQVEAGSPVQITVTVTNSSISPDTLPVDPSTIANTVSVIDKEPEDPLYYIPITGTFIPCSEAPAKCANEEPSYYPVRGTFTPASCTLSSDSCVFSYTPPPNFNGTVSLIAVYQGAYQNSKPGYNAYSTGIASLVVTRFQGTPPAPPSHANMLVAQHGNLTVRYVSSFGSPGNSDGQMQGPQGIALDQAGNIYVAEIDNNRIDKFDPSGHLISKIGVGLLGSPTNVVVDRSGNVYVVDVNGDTAVYKFGPSGNLVSKFEPYGKCNLGDPTHDNKEPQGIAVDGQGNVYLTDLCNIQKYDANGNLVLKFGSLGSGNGQLDHTGDLTVDKSGYIYVADGNERVEKFDSTGTFQGWIGNCTPQPGTNCDATSDATTGFCTNCIAFSQGECTTPTACLNDDQFRSAQGISIDKYGNMWVTDSDNNKVQVFDPSGKFMFKFGTQGTFGDFYPYDPSPAQFAGMNDIVIDSSDNMYITDMNNDRVQVFHIDYGSSQNQDVISSSLQRSQEMSQATLQQTTSTQHAVPAETIQDTLPQQTQVPSLSSISKAPGWVKELFRYHDHGQLSDPDLINAINFLAQQRIIKLT